MNSHLPQRGGFGWAQLGNQTSLAIDRLGEARIYGPFEGLIRTQLHHHRRSTKTHARSNCRRPADNLTGI